MKGKWMSSSARVAFCQSSFHRWSAYHSDVEWNPMFHPSTTGWRSRLYRRRNNFTFSWNLSVPFRWISPPSSFSFGGSWRGRATMQPWIGPGPEISWSGSYVMEAPWLRIPFLQQWQRQRINGLVARWSSDSMRDRKCAGLLWKEYWRP